MLLSCQAGEVCDKIKPWGPAAAFGGGGSKKDGRLTSCGSGMEACVKPSREINSGEAIHITFETVLGILGSIASIMSLVIALCERKK